MNLEKKRRIYIYICLNNLLSIIHYLAMDEGAKRMEEGINVALDIDEAKDEDLKNQETTNINGNSSMDQHDTADTMAKPALVKQKTKRVATLDAFRGLTIVVISYCKILTCYN